MANFLTADFPAGSIFGIPIRVHFLLLALVFFQCLAAVLDAEAAYWRPLIYTFSVYGPVLFGSVLIHELGHALAARQVGGRVDKIILWPLGGLALIEHEAGPKGDLWVSLAGPLTHIPQAALWFLIGYLLPARPANIAEALYDLDHLFRSIVWTAFAFNVILLVFNLFIPAYPLDGGRILVDGLLLCGVPPRATAVVTIFVSVAGAGGLIALSAMNLLGWGGYLIAAFILMGTGLLAWFLCSGNLSQHPLFKVPVDSSLRSLTSTEVVQQGSQQEQV